MRKYANPISRGLTHIADKLSDLEFEGVNTIPSLITAIVLFVVGGLFLLLWPFGLISVVENMLRDLITDTHTEMEPVPAIEKTSYVIAIGLYVIVWLPFWVLNLPFLLIGGIGVLMYK